MRPLLKRLLSHTIGPLFRTAGARVLYFHSIHPQYRLSTSPDEFSLMLDECGRLNRGLVTVRDLGELLKASSISGSEVAITFDDGYLDNYEHAFPILCAHRVRATFFVVAGAIAGESLQTGRPLYVGLGMMSKEHVRELSTAGMEIASHTWSHRTLANADRRTIVGELERSKKFLEDLVGKPVTSFCYPNGEIPRGVPPLEMAELLRSLGYKQAVTTRWGCIANGTDPLDMRRQIVDYYDSVADFGRKLRGYHDYVRLVHWLRGSTQRLMTLSAGRDA